MDQQNKDRRVFKCGYLSCSFYADTKKELLEHVIAVHKIKPLDHK